MYRSRLSKFFALITVFLLASTLKLSAQENASIEGIQVHGHWTITVKNQQGKVIEKREFENSLSNNGSQNITEMMAGEFTFGAWSISTNSMNSQNDICQGEDANGNPTPSQCIISSYDSSQNFVFNTLNISTPNSGDNANSLVLTGNFTAAYDGNIGHVHSIFHRCDSSTSPDNCTTGSGGQYAFTSKTLDSAVSILANQQVSITVVLSFS